MHKKFFVLVVAIALVTVGMGFGQGVSDSQTFNLKVMVQKYIEVNPLYKTMSPHITIPGHADDVTVDGGTWDQRYAYLHAYANCPFSISFEGHNEAGDLLPILARHETPVGNGWDRLQTRIHFRYSINIDGFADNEVHEINFKSDPNGANTGKWDNKTVTFNNAPHNGEVLMRWNFGAALPHKTPYWVSRKSWKLSADAGEYTCTVVVTYTAL